LSSVWIAHDDDDDEMKQKLTRGHLYYLKKTRWVYFLWRKKSPPSLMKLTVTFTPYQANKKNEKEKKGKRIIQRTQTF